MHTRGTFDHTIKIVLSCTTYQQLLVCEFYVMRWARAYKPKAWQVEYLNDLIYGRQMTLIHATRIEQAVEYSRDTVEHTTRIRELNL